MRQRTRSPNRPAKQAELRAMTIQQALKSAAQALETAGVPDPRLDAELLLSHVTDLERLIMLMNPSATLTTQQEQRFSSLLLSRVQREPLQYLLGTQYFYGLELKVDGRALIPRQETETLCELGIRFLRSQDARQDCPSSALDLCTGSGAIAIALKHECPHTLVCAADMSAEALQLAGENARQIGTEICFFQGDLFAAVSGRRFQLILSNPPYVATADCDTLQAEVLREPRMALDGGPDGLHFYRRIAAGAPAHLQKGGLLAVEAGDGQADAIAALLRQSGLRDVCIHNDLYGMPRVVSSRAEDFT